MSLWNAQVYEYFSADEINNSSFKFVATWKVLVSCLEVKIPIMTEVSMTGSS